MQLFKKNKKIEKVKDEKYIWKVISYVFLALIVAMNIWLVVFINSKPYVTGNDLTWSFLVGKKAFDPITGMQSIQTSAEGIAFYTVSSIIWVASIVYGVILYKLYRSRAMWTYFMTLTFYAASFVATYLLVYAISLNGVGIYRLINNVPSNPITSCETNLFWNCSLDGSQFVFTKQSSAWIYNSAEIVCFVITIPMMLVYYKSRKAPEVQ